MITYITAFIFYTLAMIGILLVGFVIYKKTFVISKGENKGMIRILDSYPIGPKKVLMVVKIRNERFLIASGVEHTTFLAKLSDKASDKISDKAVDEMISKAPTTIEQPIQKIKTQNIKNVPKMEEVQPKKQSERRISEEEIQRRFDEMEQKQAHLDKVQKQFEELYAREEAKDRILNKEFAQRELKAKQAFEQSEAFKKAPQRREMIRKLLNEINETKTVKTGRI